MPERSISKSRGYLVVIFFAFLDSVESDDEGDIDNIINGSDTEFVAEDGSVLYYNQKKSAKKRSMTKLAPCQFQKHQFTFFYPK